VFMLANMFNRTRIVVDEVAVAWTNGPLLATRVRMTYEEARTIRAFERRAGRTNYIKLDFLRAEVGVSLGTTLDKWDHANWLIDRVKTELTRH
jgi:hypothetical protein